MGDDGEKIAVYKINLDCKKCEEDVKSAIIGVGSVRVTTDCSKNEVTVVGNFDPVKMKKRLEDKLKKKNKIVEIVSLQPKKAPHLKKLPPPPSLTPREDILYLKIRLYYEECIPRIKKLINNNKGVKSVEFYDYEGKNLVRVKGYMDYKALVQFLRNNMERSIEVFVPPKKVDMEAPHSKKLAPLPPPPDLTPREDILYLKIRLYYEECIPRISKLINNNKGVTSVNFYDYEGKNLVRVKGSMDYRDLVQFLKNNMERSVEVFVPPKKVDREAPRTGNKICYIVKNLQINNIIIRTTTR